MKKEINPIAAAILIAIVVVVAVVIGWRVAAPSGPGTEPQPKTYTGPPPPAPPGTYFPPDGRAPVRINPDAAPNPENPMLDMQRK